MNSENVVKNLRRCGEPTDHCRDPMKHMLVGLGCGPLRADRGL